ncbi:hypothetical protein TSUD_62780 [Trifolium subterraneum]|uniref:Protein DETOXIFICATION n=1 Tax=Trifolium subterraneum TaxID=3900 RepID=A0A2Z6MB80_TRISU|nr:hypothetical protein TSUD_62780 [Trifolium subterraneum]
MTLKLSLHFHHTFHLKILKLATPSHLPLHRFYATNSLLNDTFTISSNLVLAASKHHRIGILTPCAVGSNEQNGESGDEDCCEEMGEKKELAEQSVWNQMKEIVKFTGPAIGLWLCDPLMSLIDTAVVGQGSSTELAALGPATVVCDYMTLTFMFLSVVTSNIIATALAKQDREDVQHHLSILLFIGLACGLVMLLSTKLLGAATLSAFTGPKNAHVVPAANTYVQIRALSWPALLVGWVAQSASLGMKDSWGPLKALAAASVINGIGDILLCSFLGYGIAGAAWATMASQVVASYMMIQTLNKRGYNAYAFSVPSMNEFLTILGLAAPVAFFSLLIYIATSIGTQTMAAHQVMIQIYMACTVWGEPLCQTAQSFMPELMYGVNKSLSKARLLLRSLVIIGAILGVLLGIVGTSLLWLFPYIFTSDQMVIQKDTDSVLCCTSCDTLYSQPGGNIAGVSNTYSLEKDEAVWGRMEFNNGLRPSSKQCLALACF